MFSSIMIIKFFHKKYSDRLTDSLKFSNFHTFDLNQYLTIKTNVFIKDTLIIFIKLYIFFDINMR